MEKAFKDIRISSHLPPLPVGPMQQLVAKSSCSTPVNSLVMSSSLKETVPPVVRLPGRDLKQVKEHAHRLRPSVEVYDRASRTTIERLEAREKFMGALKSPLRWLWVGVISKPPLDFKGEAFTELAQDLAVSIRVLCRSTYSAAGLYSQTSKSFGDYADLSYTTFLSAHLR